MGEAKTSKAGLKVGRITFGPGVNLPTTEWATRHKVDPDDLATTRITVQSGYAGPHTTICMSPDRDSNDIYHLLWWTVAAGDSGAHGEEMFEAQIRKGDGWSGWRMLREVLTVVEDNKGEG